MSDKIFEIPNKISSYIRKLEVFYRSEKDEIYHEIICDCKIYVKECTSYDEWDGGVDGHSIILFIDENIFLKTSSIKKQKDICDKIRNDLVECSRHVRGEYIDTVILELKDETDQDYILSKNPLKQLTINHNLLNIWKPGAIRLFISHRDSHKIKANELAKYLEKYGISCFVAHDNIEPLEEWKPTIVKAMKSMEIMLAFITDDFFESDYTAQEIGFALGRGVPVIPLKLENTDPKGFNDIIQAIPANLDSLNQAAIDIYEKISKKLGFEKRLTESTINAFLGSEDFDEAKIRFNSLKTLSSIKDSDIEKILKGFSRNEALYKAFYLTNEHNRLTNFLNNRTGKKYEIRDNDIIEMEPDLDEEIPF